MTTTQDPQFRAALRAALVQRVNETPNHRRRARSWYRSKVMIVPVVVATGVLGGGVAVAAGVLTLPGADRVTPVGPEVTASGGTRTVQLADRPADADSVQITLTCRQPGTFTFPDGASVTCNSEDSKAAEPVSYTLPISPKQSSVEISSTSDGAWSAVLSYAVTQQTAWAKNADGLTYGVINSRGTPDLVAAIATNGQQGYVYASELASPTFTDPGAAATWSQDHAGSHRNLAVYTSDGHTKIGEFIQQ